MEFSSHNIVEVKCPRAPTTVLQSTKYELMIYNMELLAHFRLRLSTENVSTSYLVYFPSQRECKFILQDKYFGSVENEIGPKSFCAIHRLQKVDVNISFAPRCICKFHLNFDFFFRGIWIRSLLAFSHGAGQEVKTGCHEANFY